MPFTISVKRKGSSNKHKTPPHFGHLSPCQEVLPVEGPIPFIDRLTVTLNVPTREQGQDMWQAHCSAEKDKETFKKQGYGKGYNQRYRISLPSTVDAKHWPLYEIAYEQGCINRLRLDFNPADLGHEGMEELHFVLSALMDTGWGFVAKYGKVTRLDVAVDLPEVNMEHLMFLPKQGVTSQQWHQSGQLQSYQLGKSKGNRTMIYNRKAKRISQGKPWAGKEGIRVERRLRNPGITVQGMHSLPWPFEGLHVVKRMSGPPAGELKGYIWRLFVGTAENSGIAAALAILPTKKRSMYRKHCNEHNIPLWDADAIWGNWTKTLADLEIADPKAWC